MSTTRFIGKLPLLSRRTGAAVLASACVLSLAYPSTAASAEGDRAWTQARGALEAVIRWGIYIGLAVLVVAGLVALRRLIRAIPASGRTTVALEDLTADAKERNARNQALTRELISAMRSAGSSESRHGIEIDETRDLDGTLHVNLRAAGEGVATIDSLISDETPVKIGPLSFNPRQALYFGSAFFRRRSEVELVGFLTASEQTAEMMVQQFAPGQKLPVQRWTETVQGENSRARVVASVATKIAIDLGGSHISTKWSSVRDYREACARLSSGEEPANREDDREKLLESVRRILEHALNADPGNVLARFELATVLRKLGENEVASEHFVFLERLATLPLPAPSRRLIPIELSPAEPTAGVHGYLERHPEFVHVARYNRAISLSKVGSWEGHEKALEILWHLVPEILEDERLDPQTSLRLHLLTVSAWAAALVFRLEHWRLHSEGEIADRPEARETRAQIAQIRDWVETLPDTHPELDLAAYVYARATVQGAFGRAAQILGDHDEAMAAFERALSMIPDLGDVHANLASLLIKLKARHMNWSRRARNHLLRALEISPLDERAHFLLGKVYADPSVGQLKEAKQQFEQGGSYGWACYEHARLLKDEGQIEAAINQLRRTLHAFPNLSRTPARECARAYLELIIQLGGEQKADKAMVNEAQKVAQRLVEVTLDGGRDQAAKLLTGIDALA